MSFIIISALAVLFGGSVLVAKKLTKQKPFPILSKYNVRFKLVDVSVSIDELNSVLDHWVNFVSQKTGVSVADTLNGQNIVIQKEQTVEPTYGPCWGFVEFRSGVVYVWLPDTIKLYQSALFHELIHVYLYKKTGNYNSDHSLPEWGWLMEIRNAYAKKNT